MGYLCHLVISISVIWVINHFPLNWNVCICMLVEYFGGSKSIPHYPKQIAWLVWRRNEYQWICPTPPIITNLCPNIYRENRYDYVLVDLPCKLDDKTYRRNEKFNRLYSWLILEFVGELWILMKIYTKQHMTMFFNTRNSIVISKFAQANNKESITAQNQWYFLRESTTDLIAVLPKHYSQLPLTQFWIQMDIHELICS